MYPSPHCGKTNHNNPMLEQLFGSKTRVKLLYLFYQYPGRSFYVREMTREIDSQLNAVRREIAILEKIGLIGVASKDDHCNLDTGKVQKVGSVSRAKYYCLRTDCLFYLELKALLMKGQILRERAMIEKLKQKAGEVELMILTGVFADCADVETDIFLVGRVKPVNVAKIIKEYEKKLSKTIRYTIMSTKEYLDRKEIGDKFLYSIFESKCIIAIDEL